jgi:hypothetical protein
MLGLDPSFTKPRVGRLVFPYISSHSAPVRAALYSAEMLMSRSKLFACRRHASRGHTKSFESWRSVLNLFSTASSLCLALTIAWSSCSPLSTCWWCQRGCGVLQGFHCCPRCSKGYDFEHRKLFHRTNAELHLPRTRTSSAAPGLLLRFLLFALLSALVFRT